MLSASKIKHICLSGASKWGEEWWSDYCAWKLEFQGLCWMSSMGEVTFAWSFANRCGLWVWVDEFKLGVVLIWWCGFWISLDHVKLFWCVDEVSEYLSAQNHISLLGGIQFLKHCTIWGLFMCVRVSKTATTGLAATTQDLHLTQAAAAKQNSWGHLHQKGWTPMWTPCLLGCPEGWGADLQQMPNFSYVCLGEMACPPRLKQDFLSLFLREVHLENDRPACGQET